MIILSAVLLLQRVLGQVLFKNFTSDKIVSGQSQVSVRFDQPSNSSLIVFFWVRFSGRELGEYSILSIDSDIISKESLLNENLISLEYIKARNDNFDAPSDQIPLGGDERTQKKDYICLKIQKFSSTNCSVTFNTIVLGTLDWTFIAIAFSAWSRGQMFVKKFDFEYKEFTALVNRIPFNFDST